MMKNRRPLEVPTGVRFLSDWEKLWDEFPEEHFILNKRLTNVGATYYFLENDHKIILCSPRCSLIESKREKHKNVWIYRSIFDETSSDADKIQKPSTKKATGDDILRFNADTLKYIGSCKENGIVPKVMTTYDSLGHVIDVLKTLPASEIDQWTLVVDEFQSLFADSAYKATTELNFLYNSKFFKRAIFLSATPYLEEYMEKLPDFESMQYIELVWPEEMQATATVTNITLGKKESIPSTCKKIIDCMRAGRTVKLGSKEIDTTEAVLYINKVSTIRDIIKKCGLKPSEVNILCAKSDDNDRRLKEVGHVRGCFPKEGEQNKMFTFCTRSQFLGVDLYSDCAYSYVFADPTQKTLALDISTDLTQILGRQRNELNPYQHEAILFMKENSVGLGEDEFSKYISDKKHTTEMLIKNYEEADDAMKEILLKTYRKFSERDHYSENYLCVRDDRMTGKAVVEFNILVMLSEIRAWDIRKKKYSSQYQVIAEQNASGIIGTVGTQSTNPDVLQLKTDIDVCRTAVDKLRCYAEFRRDHPDLAGEIDFMSPKYANFWDALGYDGLKKLGFQDSKIKELLTAPVPFDNTLDNVILELRATLKEKKYTMKEVKEKLEKIYKKVGLARTAKATDLYKYVTAKTYQDSKTGKRYIQVLSVYQKSITLFPLVWRPNVPITKGMTIDRFLDIIETGNYKIRQNSSKSRSLKDVIKDIRTKKSHDSQGNLKKKWLPVGCINGVFDYKDDHGLTVYSSFIALDYDGFASVEEMTEAIEKLKTYPFVYAIFSTPSGNGLKAIVLHNSTNPGCHHNLYMQVLKACELPQTDASVTDLSRGQFLSYDPGLWRNPNAVPFHFVYDNRIDIPKSRKEKTVKSEGTVEELKLDTWESEFLYKLWQNILTDEAILERLDKYWTTKKPEYFKVGNRHASMLVISGTLCKAGIPQKKTIEYLTKAYPQKEQDEIESVTSYSYERNAYGCDRRRYK